MNWKLRSFLWLVVFWVALASQASGQTSFGSINGTVRDETGMRIPGAEVILVNMATNVRTDAIANDSGFFQIVNVRPGTYTLSVELPGFKTARTPPFIVGVNESVTQNVTLEVGEITEVVEVVAGTDVLQTSSAELGNVVEEQVIRELPLQGRNFTQLLLLTPGVNPISTAQGPQSELGFGTEGNSGVPGSAIVNASIQGQQNRSKVYYMDGIINTSVRAGTYVALPDIDSLQEFKVQSHNDRAEYGGATGGVINMVSKSGTNRLRGSVFEFVRNDMFDARNPFRDEFRDSPPVFRQNQFGANIGGPVIRDKTFFFFGYDGWRYRDVADIRHTVPTGRELDGDFSQTFHGRTIYNPFTTRVEEGRLVRDPFPNNQIPQDLISPLMQGFLKTFMVQPNVPGDISDNFRTERAQKSDSNSFQIRLDHHFGQQDNLFFRWTERRINNFIPVGDRGFRTPEAINRNFGGGWFHSFSPSLILEVRGGKATQPTEDAPFEHEAGGEILRQLGVPEIDRFAGYTIGGLSPWGVPTLGVQGPRPRGNPNWNAATDMTWLRGNHNFKVGFQYLEIARDQRNQFGQINFGTEQTRNPQNPGTTGDGLASALLGIPARIQGFVHELGSIDFKTATWSTYFQDQWKLRPHVTLTYGLRYDYITKATGEGLQSGPDLKTGEWLLALERMPDVCAGQAPPCLPAPLEQIPFSNLIRVTGEPFSIIRPIKDNWGPRVGLAWQMNDNTVLRTGYGLMWDSMVSRSQYAQHQFESWGWPQFSGIDTGDINREGETIQTLADVGSLPFVLPSPHPWNSGGWFNDPERKNAYSHQWHVEIQREVTRALMLSVGYVGSVNGRLEYAGFASGAAQPGVEPGTGRRLLPEERNQLRPWPHLTGGFRYSEDIGISNYNSFQFRAQRRFSDGLASVLSYTWSKSIDTSSGWFLAETGAGHRDSNIQNYWDPDSNRGVSGYDVPHLVTWATVWEIPAGRGKPWLNEGPASWILGNWQMNWMFLARSGQPVNVGINGDIANIGVNNTIRPNLVGNPNASNPTAQQWFNANAFEIPVNDFGSAGRNIVRGPGFWNLDFGLQRNVPVTEGTQLQLRVEAFNIFNHMNLGHPQGRFDLPTFGQITSLAARPRQMQFGFRFLF